MNSWDAGPSDLGGKTCIETLRLVVPSSYFLQGDAMSSDVGGKTCIETLRLFVPSSYFLQGDAMSSDVDCRVHVCLLQSLRDGVIHVHVHVTTDGH